MKRWNYMLRTARSWWGPLLGACVGAGCGGDRVDVSSLVADGDGRDQRDSGVSNKTVESGDARDERDSEAATEASTGNEPKTAADVEPTGAIGSGTDAGATAFDSSAPLGQVEPGLAFDDEPIYSEYVRLTHEQWDNSVIDNLRLDTPTGQLGLMLPDPAVRYSNNESVLFVRKELVADYRDAAEVIAQRIIGDASALDRVHTSREPRVFIEDVGRRFYRRPLSPDEVATYLALFEVGMGLAPSAADTFPAGVQLLLEAWMQAPSFLYRVEVSEGLLNGYEMATRLAYLLADSTPSDALLDAAATGELDTADGVERAARELLETPRAESVFRRFHDETFALHRLETLQVDDALGLEPGLNKTLLDASHLFFDRLFREEQGVRELFLSEVGYVNAVLAPLYGLSAPTTDDFELVSLGPSRRGVFAQLPFLMVDSINETPNIFRRGALFTNYVLCQTLSEQPATVPMPPVSEERDGTNRERSAELVSESACQACHEFIDPFGFAFENFDGLGRERNTDNGSPVDTTGTYPFAGSVQFADSTELMQVLAESPLAHGCYVKQLTEFSLSRSLGFRDAALVHQLRAQSLERGSSLMDLVISLVSSETFRSAGGSP